MPPTNTGEQKSKASENSSASECQPSTGPPAIEAHTPETQETKRLSSEPLTNSGTPENDKNTTAFKRLAGDSHVFVRNKRIDCLRGVAVLSVVFLHSAIRIPVFSKAGWMGVDLFFVLSGFLISGLLFREYQKRQTIDVRRFFIRRGLKIYPSFWLFLAVTWGISQLNHDAPTASPQAYLRELFFIQNYFPGVWIHTWSLAVEEHFYILLPLFLLALTRLSRNRRDPFWCIGWCAAAIGFACIFVRLALVVLPQNPNFHLAYQGTHARIDSLFFGVLLGYLYNYHRNRLERALGSTFRRIAIAAASIGLLLPGYFVPRDSKAFSVLGYTMLYLGFGGILLLSVHVRGVLPLGPSKWLRPIGDGLAYVGMHSYSIYLWHFAILGWPNLLAYRFFQTTLPPIPYLILYLVLCLTMGITISRAVEYPILKLRDRLFPERQTE
jgi:peptidoglycan/LPS O-acetylase OafA/YrhL